MRDRVHNGSGCLALMTCWMVVAKPLTKAEEKRVTWGKEEMGDNYI